MHLCFFYSGEFTCSSPCYPRSIIVYYCTWRTREAPIDLSIREVVYSVIWMGLRPRSWIARTRPWNGIVVHALDRRVWILAGPGSHTVHVVDSLQNFHTRSPISNRRIERDQQPFRPEGNWCLGRLCHWSFCVWKVDRHLVLCRPRF